MVEADNPLKNGLEVPSVSKVNFRSCLLFEQRPRSVNMVFLVANSHSEQTLLGL